MIGEVIDLGPRLCAACVSDGYWILYEGQVCDLMGRYQEPLTYRAFAWSDLVAAAAAIQEHSTGTLPREVRG